MDLDSGLGSFFENDPDNTPVFQVHVVTQAIDCPNCGVLFLDRDNRGMCKGCFDPTQVPKKPASEPPRPTEPFVYIDPDTIDLERY